jgi:uncharacterized protein YukE
MSRIDSKNVWPVIAGLEKVTVKYEEELTRFNSQIKRLEDKLGKIDDKIRELSVRAQSLGKDAEGNQYWVFPSDSEKLLVKLPDAWGYYLTGKEVQ